MTTDPTLEELRQVHDALAHAMGWKRAYHFDRGAPVLASRWVDWVAQEAVYARACGAAETCPDELEAVERLVGIETEGT